MKRVVLAACLALTSMLLRAQNVPVAPAVIPMPPDNPFACRPDTPGRLVTHPLASGVTVDIPEMVAFHLDAKGDVKSALPVHDPIPTLGQQQQASLLRWRFTPPKKGGAPVEGWATVRLDLRMEYSRPDLTKISFMPVAPDMPLPPPLDTVWDDSWISTAPPLKDLAGGVSAEELDSPPLPEKTKWSADKYKGPLKVRLWIKVGTAGHVEKIVPVEWGNPAVFAYLQRTVARWTFVPSARGGSFLDCWGILDLEGHITYDVSLVQAASLKKSIGPK